MGDFLAFSKPPVESVVVVIDKSIARNRVFKAFGPWEAEDGVA